MKVSYNWLSTMVDVLPNAKTLAERLDMTGTAVDDLSSIGASLDGIVVGHILERRRHPNADTLWVTTVDVGRHNQDEDGQNQPLQIVCGAQNFKAGDKVPVALVGSVVPTGQRIKKSKLRGVESCGMNCSVSELGLGTDAAGIMILPDDAEVGMPLAQHLRTSDTILDLEITPNRPDCMSMLGIAREVGAILERPYHLGRKITTPPTADSVENYVRVTIADPGRCRRYTARVIKGVRIGPSPPWLAERVTAAGTRSINNIVDVTNYIMYELGQPLHAFDLNTLVKDEQGRVHIVVRAAEEGEAFTTLDGVDRALSSDMTVIVDGNANNGAGVPIALAGVMGGLDSEVTDTTVDILLESATFDSGHTSRTSRSLQLFSEASARYERGVDDATCDEFSARAAALMAEVSNGSVCAGVVDTYPAPRVIPRLRLHTERLQRFVGADIAPEDSVAILRRLGCVVTKAGEKDTVFWVVPPSYRPDLEREIDLYEEVLRVWGMERVVPTLPGGEGRVGRRSAKQRTLDRIGSTLRALGLNETMTYAFAATDDQERLGMPWATGTVPVELLNPINSEQAVMRASIIPGLLRSVAYNQNRGVANVHLYELGTVFLGVPTQKLPTERQVLATVLAGSWTRPGWNMSASLLDFFDVKALIENLARELGITKLAFEPLDAEAAPWLQAGQAACVKAGSNMLGWLGQLHPLAVAAFGAEPAVLAFELEVEALLSAACDRRAYQDVSAFPAVELDLAIVVDESVSAEEALSVTKAAGGALLQEVHLFDVFRDIEKIGPDKKSLALSLSYRAQDRTLTLSEVEKLQARVVRKLSGSLGATLRS
ncbi:MAG: phenylalanine--tRNA ligase subunit beta [Coriobacteriales bacterium]|jgi:phenylalanyl-tRNA synthetase beta chain|nr:phenylalanine--tRNA ligase subunit beta [Coriobacteriales bacterium]